MKIKINKNYFKQVDMPINIVGYGIYQEYGTSRISPHYFIRNALKNYYGRVKDLNQLYLKIERNIKGNITTMNLIKTGRMRATSSVNNLQQAEKMLEKYRGK